MHALDILGDPVRRRILELLVSGERTSGAVVEVVNREFGISQPAVSQHLKVLREAGFTTVRVDGQRRLYAINSRPLEEAAQWLDQFRAFWQHKFDALETEIARGKRERRSEKSSERKRSAAARKSG
jgi:DNA-binding transcriptional ArsR family regulator